MINQDHLRILDNIHILREGRDNKNGHTQKILREQSNESDQNMSDDNDDLRFLGTSRRLPVPMLQTRRIDV